MKVMLAISLLALAGVLWASLAAAQHIRRARRRKRASRTDIGQDLSAQRLPHIDPAANAFRTEDRSGPEGPGQPPPPRPAHGAPGQIEPNLDGASVASDPDASGAEDVRPGSKSPHASSAVHSDSQMRTATR